MGGPVSVASGKEATSHVRDHGTVSSAERFTIYEVLTYSEEEAPNPARLPERDFRSFSTTSL